jgi:Domain of unknown function (DUF1877)
MGMTGGLVRASLEEIARVREHPAELPEFLDCGIWAPPNREVQRKGILGWLLALTPVRIYESDPDAVPPPGAEHGALRPNVDLDKAWEPLHFLLTGTAQEGEEPTCYLARGGEELVEQLNDELGDQETRYSSIRVLTPEKIAAFDRYLSSLTIDELRRRFDIDRMVELRIYAKRRSPKPPTDDDRTLDHLIETFEDLRTFVRETAASGAGAIAYLT